MALNFVDLVQTLENFGVLDVLIPFLLIFTIVFAVLQRTHILGKEKETKRYNVIIAIVMAFGVVIPHVIGAYPPGSDIVVIINTALPNVSLVIVAAIMVLLLIGVFGGELAGPATGGIALIAFLIVAYIFAVSAGWFQNVPSWLRWAVNPDTQALLVILIVFGLIVWFITRDEETNKDEGILKGAGEMFSGLFKK
jgi:lysylphosphatidylglycerol synthetase-like protein (DUF2156 family)